MTSKAPFLFPVRAGDISLFCHPSPASPLHLPHYIGGSLTAGNGHIAIRAERGQWTESDFTPAPENAAQRLSALPWHRFPPESPEWRPLDDIRGLLYAHAPIAPFTDRHRVAPCPVWQIADHHLARLSHLQLLARLPRVRVYAGPAAREDPLFFRYNGGIAIMPRDKRLTTHSRRIFIPARDCLTGHRRDRPSQPTGANTRPPKSHLPGWPPPEPIDD